MLSFVAASIENSPAVLVAVLRLFAFVVMVAPATAILVVASVTRPFTSACACTAAQDSKTPNKQKNHLR
jgi:multisubunit Na+/H+ antiporter MnhG subunit